MIIVIYTCTLVLHVQERNYMSVKAEIVFLYLFFTTKLSRFVIAKLTPSHPAVTYCQLHAGRHFWKISVILWPGNVKQNLKNRMISVASPCRLRVKSGIPLSAGFTKQRRLQQHANTRGYGTSPFSWAQLIRIGHSLIIN